MKHLPILLLLPLSLGLQAQDFNEVQSINEIPEEYRVPVKSTKAANIKDGVLDTLLTSDPRIKMVIYEDKTWDYIKDTDSLLMLATMREYWDEEKIQPYKTEYAELPFRATLWLVDSLERYCCPCNVPVYSKFGIRHGRNHSGVDLPSPTGTPAYAAFSGKVRISMYTKGYGNLIVLRHPNGLETYYGHLTKRNVSVGDWVNAGEVVGLIGSTGRSTGPHLHFETRYKGFAFDPQWLIDFEKGDLRKSVFILKKKFLSNYSRYTPENLEEEESIMLTEEQERAELARIEAERAAMRWHTVKSGDTLSRIAVNNGTTVTAICRLNQGLTPKTTLKIGRKIRVR